MTSGVTLTFGGTASSPNPFDNSSPVYASPGYGPLLSSGVFDQLYAGSPPHTLPAWTVLNHGAIYGPGASGIYLQNGGIIVNYASAIIGGDTGIVISRYTTAGPEGTVVNSGSILGGTGVVLLAGTITNKADALIGGNYAAVSIAQGGTITNYGTLHGTVHGIALYSGGGVTNSGTVLATSASGVLLNHGGIVHNVVGSAASIALIEGYNAIAGTRVAGTSGVIAIYNSGTLLGAPGDAISLNSGGVVINYGSIVGGSIRSGIYSNGGGYTRVENEGTIRGFGGVSIGEGYVTNTGTGFIDGGVVLRGYGVVVNQRGTTTPLPVIQSNTAIPNAVAVQLYGLLLNDAYVLGGVIDQWGTFGTDTAVPTVINSGIITGQYDAVDLRSFLGTPFPSGVFSNIGSLADFGIVSGANGVIFSHLSATVSNLGTIYGTGTHSSYGYGLQLNHSGGTIQNGTDTLVGLIYGHRVGLSIYYGSATTTNFGTIEGGFGFSSYGGTNNNTLINFGTIIGTGGHAVEFGNGNNLLIDEPGAAFSGNVFAAGGTNALELASGASSGTLHGLGFTFKDFASVTIDTGAKWYIDGSNYNALTHQPSTLTNNGIFNVTPGGRFTVFGSIGTPITLQAASTLAVRSGATLTATTAEVPAVIAGANGVVANYGLIDPTYVGVTLLAAGTVLNGSRFSASATIAGYDAAVDLNGKSGTLVNYGTVRALGSSGIAVVMGTGDVVLNGITGSTTPLITGVLGIADNGGTIVNGSTAHATGTIYGSGAYAIGLAGTGAVLTNFAHVLAPVGLGPGTGGDGVRLHAGVVNNAAGDIRGDTGIYAYAGTIANDGTIRGNGSIGVDFLGSGAIINGSIAGTAATIGGLQTGIGIANGGTAGIFDAVTVQNNGLVSGDYGNGIDINGALATVINSYSVRGKADGILAKQLSLPTTVPTLNITNTASAAILGTIGIQADGRTNLFNAGVIGGTGGTAVSLGAADDLVTLAPGAIFFGTVNAGGGHNLLELAGGLVTGTISGFASSIINFTTLMTDAAATWDFAGSSVIGAGVSLINQGAIQASAGDDLTILAAIAPQFGSPSVVQVFAGGTIGVYGSVASGQTLSFASSSGGEFQIGNPAAFGGTIAGFVVGGPTIDLPGITATSAGIVGNVLEVRAGGSYAASLPVTGSFTNTHVQFGPDGAGGTALTLANNPPPCFASGTRLLTSRGYRAVETLCEGEPVWAALQQAFVPVSWIGRRRIDCRRHPRPEAVRPVRIATGAFGDGCPTRDVLLSPDHAVLIGDALIPIRLLINGTSIAQVSIDAITYCHVELPRHDILLAEGLLAESYLDTGARAAFDNGGGALMLHPDFVAHRWEAAGCAPLIVAGPRLAEARRRLARYASAGGGATEPGVTEATSQSRNFAMFGAPAVSSGATT